MSTFNVVECPQDKLVPVIMWQRELVCLAGIPDVIAVLFKTAVLNHYASATHFMVRVMHHSVNEANW